MTPTTSPSSLGATNPDVVSLRLRMAPVASADVIPWRSMLRRLPAFVCVELSHFEGETVTFDVETASISRMHAQLRHLAETVQALFEPGVDGTLAFTLRPAGSTSLAWERNAQWNRGTPALVN